MHDGPEHIDRIASVLVATGAVSFRTAPFFTFTSGTQSPVYVDNRRLLGFVDERREVVDELARAARDREGIDAVAGTATAGIAWAAWLADALELPMMYVRSNAKAWGHQRAVEGLAAPGARTLLIEDLAFTGGSLTAAAESLRGEGYEVAGCLTIVTYDVPAARRAFASAEIEHRSLTTVDAALRAARAAGALTAEETDVVRAWLAEQRRDAQAVEAVAGGEPRGG